MDIRRLTILTRIVIWLSPVMLFVWIASENLVATGSVTLRCSAQRCDAQLQSVAAREREVLIGRSKSASERYRVITADPFSFDVQLFRSANAATVRMTYDNPDDQEVLRLGVLQKGSRYDYYQFANDNPLLTALEVGWNTVVDGETTLFQRPKANVRQYQSLVEFLADPPDQRRVGTYNVDLSARIRLPGYEPSTAKRTDDVNLRGSHVFVVYVGTGEPLDLTFALQDINRHAGKDDVTFKVFRGAELVTTAVVRDDGNEKANGAVSAVREFQLSVPDLVEGTYTIEALSSTDDPFIRSITTSHRFVRIDRKLYLAGSNEYRALGRTADRPVTVYVRGTTLSAVTTHANSLQTIIVGGKRLELTKVSRAATTTLPKGLIAVTVPVPDVSLETDGTFVLSPSEDFSLEGYAAPPVSTVANLDDRDYVVAKYAGVKADGRWLVAEHRVTNLPAGRTLHFAITGVPSFSDANRELRVKELEVRIEADPLTPGRIMKLLRSYLSKKQQGSI